MCIYITFLSLMMSSYYIHMYCFLMMSWYYIQYALFCFADIFHQIIADVRNMQTRPELLLTNSFPIALPTVHVAHYWNMLHADCTVQLCV